MVALPLVILAVTLIVWTAQERRDDLLRRIEGAALGLQVAVDREIGLTIATLEALATSPALDQALGVFHALGGLGLIVDLEPLDVAATELAAFFVQGHAKGVLDGLADLAEGAGVGQHQAHTHFVALSPRNGGQQQAGGGRADKGGTAGEDEAA